MQKLRCEDVFEFTAAEGVYVVEQRELEEAGIKSVYPNPFLDNFSVDYQLAVFARVKIELFDLLGRRIQLLMDEEQGAGLHQLIWNRTNKEPLASGS